MQEFKENNFQQRNQLLQMFYPKGKALMTNTFNKSKQAVLKSTAFRISKRYANNDPNKNQDIANVPCLESIPEEAEHATNEVLKPAVGGSSRCNAIRELVEEQESSNGITFEASEFCKEKLWITLETIPEEDEDAVIPEINLEGCYGARMMSIAEENGAEYLEFYSKQFDERKTFGGEMWNEGLYADQICPNIS